MTRAEEIADEEVLLQVTRPGVGPSMAPELAVQLEQEEPVVVVDNVTGRNVTEALDMLDQLGDVNETDMVEGWGVERTLVMKSTWGPLSLLRMRLPRVRA